MSRPFGTCAVGPVAVWTAWPADVGGIGGKEATMAHATSANEICRMEAVQLAGEIRARNLSSVEVIDAVLARMDRLEPVLHAFCTPTPEAAREDAERIDAELKAGRDLG